MADNTAMLSICDNIHVVLIRTDQTGDTTLVSSHFLEWRPVLSSSASRLTTSVELRGTGIVIIVFCNICQGPVVQSIVSLTRSLDKDWLSLLVQVKSIMLIILLKNK